MHYLKLQHACRDTLPLRPGLRPSGKYSERIDCIVWDKLRAGHDQIKLPVAEANMSEKERQMP